MRHDPPIVGHPVWDRLTDWRYLLAITAFLTAIGMVLMGYGALSASSSAKESAKATTAQLASSQDQITVLRDQRNQLQKDASSASKRADTITTQAFAQIQGIVCTEYRTSQVAAVFASVVAASPTATDAQRALVAPFVIPPPKPAGC